jgi:CheY-specific phosphatase CheX
MNATQAKFKDSVVTALEEILDKMAFMVFEPVTPGALPAAEFLYMSHISFTGKLSGDMTLYMTRGTAEEFARNLIGIRKGDVLHNSTLEDAMREFSNILMGRALSLLAPDQHYDLQLPIAQTGPVSLSVADPDFRIEGMLNEIEPCRIDVNLSNTPSAG